jgi:hypothetical protein
MTLREAGKIPDILFGDYTPDLPLLQIGQNLSVADNMLPSDRGSIPIPTAVVQAAQLDEYCRGGYSIQYYNGSTQLFAGDRTKLYTVDSSAATDVSKAGGYDLDAGSDPYWDMTAFGEDVLAANLSELIQRFVPGGPTFLDLTEAPKAKHIATIGLQGTFLVLGHLDEAGTVSPNKVRWSGPGDLTDWASGVGLAGEQLLEGEGGPIVNLVGGEFGVILQERSVWTMEFTGPPIVFQFRQVLTDHGAVGVNASVVHNNNIYYLNRTGFYQLGRTGQGLRAIGAGRVDETFWRLVDLQRLDDIRAVSDPQSDLILWMYPSQNSPPNTSTEALIYNPTADKWGFLRETGAGVGGEFLISGYTDSVSSDDLSGLIDEPPLRDVLSDSVVFSGSRRMLIGFDQDHSLTHFSGAPRTARAETGLLQFNDLGFAMVNRLRHLVEQPGTGVKASLIIRDHPGDPGQILPLREESKYGYFELRRVRPFPRARYFQIVLEVSGGWYAFNGVNIGEHDIHAVGER